MNLVAILFSCSLSAAPPQIARQGVVNAASQWPGRLAPGSRFTIHGTGFAPATALTLVRGGTTLPVPVAHAGARRIDATLPKNLQTGEYQLMLDSGVRISYPLLVASTAFGLESRNGFGWGPARIEKRGRIITLFGTGLGSAKAVDVLAGGRPARVLRIERGATDRIQIELPTSLPPACHMPVQVRAAGSPLSNTVTLPTAEPCPIPSHFPFERWKKGPSALVVLSRTRDAHLTTDTAVAAFLNSPGDISSLGPLAYFPPAGTCATYRQAFDSETPVTRSAVSYLVGRFPGEGLDAGESLAIHDDRRQWNIPAGGAMGFYRRETTQPDVPERAGERDLFLNGPWLRVAGRGGPQVNPFAIRLPAPAPFQWTNRPTASAISRSAGVDFTWEGATPERMMIAIAASESVGQSATGLCYCVAAQSAHSLRIPPELLAHLPEGNGALQLLSWPSESLLSIQAAGLVQGAGVSVYSHLAALPFR